MIHFCDWVSKHFQLKVEFDEILNSVHFDYKDSLPSHIYTFNTDVTWNNFKSFLLKSLDQRKVIEPTCIDSNFVATLSQLLKATDCWQKLYYLLGKNFFLYFFLDCSIYIKWGCCNTFILICNFNSKVYPSKQISYYKSYKHALVVQGTGFDKDTPLSMYRMLYDTRFRRNSEYIVKSKTVVELRRCISHQSVGQELLVTAIEKKDIKILKRILCHKPTVKECKDILKMFTNNEEFMVTAHKVSLFVIEILKRHVPNNVFGPIKFFRKFLRNIQQLLKLTSKQKVTLQFLLKGFEFKGDLWKKNFVAKLAMWLLTTFVIRLICSLFYVTEVDKGCSLVFIKKNFWLNYQNEVLQKMLSDNKIVEIQGICSKDLKQLRFLPKFEGSGYRPVIKKSKTDIKNENILNLCNVFLKQLISTKKGSYPHLNNDLHGKWIKYLSLRDTKTPKHFFVKTDIKDAYGSIIHNKLKSIIEVWCKDVDENLIAMSFDFKGMWGRMETLIQFINLQPSVRNKILTYKAGNDKVVTLSEIKKVIFDYIEHIYFCLKNSKVRYHLIRGLHQGGKLSAVLCEIYYSALDDQYFKDFSTTNETTMILRAVDDYIFISQREDKVINFIETILNGFSEYGVKVQIEKTFSNCNNSLLDLKYIVDTSTVAFFGYLLNVKKGFITPNLERHDIFNTIQFKQIHQSILEQKITTVVSLKLQKVLLEPNYQTKRILYSNIHIASCLLALKFIVITHFLKLAEISVDNSFLIYCIMAGAHNIALSCAKKGKPVIKYNAAKKVCLKAFILILKRKACFNCIVIHLLRKHHQIKIISKKLSKMLKNIGKVVPPLLQKSINKLGLSSMDPFT